MSTARRNVPAPRPTECPHRQDRIDPAPAGRTVGTVRSSCSNCLYCPRHPRYRREIQRADTGPVAAIDILHKTVGAEQTIAMHPPHRAESIPGGPIQRGQTGVTEIHATLSQARRHGEIRGGRPQGSVGPDETDENGRLALVDGIAVVSKPTLPGPGVAPPIKRAILLRLRMPVRVFCTV